MAQVSSHYDYCIAFLKVCNFSHLVAALSAVSMVWMVSTSKFKTSGILFLFSSSRRLRRTTPPPNRAKKEEKKVCRFGDHYRLSLSLPSFLQSIFVPFAISKRGKQDGSFSSILIIVSRDMALPSFYENRSRRSSLTICQLSVVLFFPEFQPQPSSRIRIPNEMRWQTEISD